MSFFEKLKKGMGIEVPKEPAQAPAPMGEEEEDKKEEIKKEKEELKSKFKLRLEKKGLQSEGELAIDVYETNGDLVIQSTIAGVRAEDLDISIENDLVIIRGSRQRPITDEERKYFHQECYWGPFSRKIILSTEVDGSRAEAMVKNGVLILRIPKIERKEKRKIEIKQVE